MDALIGLGTVVWLLAIIIVVFCLSISPLMIWKHTKATSQKLDKLISLVNEKGL